MRPRRAPSLRRLAAAAACLALAMAAAPAPPEPPQELEGVVLGDSLGKLDRRFGLRRMVALRFGDRKRYVVDPDTVPPMGAGKELAERDIRKMEFEFRGARLVSVAVEYDHERGVMFDQMAAQLIGRYGDPATVASAGPVRVGRQKGLRLFLWMRTWRWKWADRELTVEGKHFGDDKENELPMRHTYVFTLARPEE